ncbi:hypothetical protein ACA910_006892 [Epithemia clementina (nom. ined.)]
MRLTIPSKINALFILAMAALLSINNNCNDGSSPTRIMVSAYYAEINPYPPVAFVWSKKDRVSRKAKEFRSALQKDAAEKTKNLQQQVSTQKQSMWQKTKAAVRSAKKSMFGAADSVADKVQKAAQNTKETTQHAYKDAKQQASLNKK